MNGMCSSSVYSVCRPQVLLNMDRPSSKKKGVEVNDTAFKEVTSDVSLLDLDISLLFPEPPPNRSHVDSVCDVVSFFLEKIDAKIESDKEGVIDYVSSQLTYLGSQKSELFLGLAESFCTAYKQDETCFKETRPFFKDVESLFTHKGVSLSKKMEGLRFLNFFTKKMSMRNKRVLESHLKRDLSNLDISPDIFKEYRRVLLDSGIPRSKISKLEGCAFRLGTVYFHSGHS